MANSRRTSANLTLRPATVDDATDLLDWRNDPVTRTMSRHTELIDREDHLQWFGAALHDPAKLLLVGVIDGSKVGVARFDLLAPRVWEVSINLSPCHRGKGLSHAVLSCALDAIKTRHPGRIIAEIKPVNSVSRHLFEACGFRKIASGEVDTYELAMGDRD
jgi:RimJ/RimL family protein N-acetyltransferase